MSFTFLGTGLTSHPASTANSLIAGMVAPVDHSSVLVKVQMTSKDFDNGDELQLIRISPSYSAKKKTGDIRRIESDKLEVDSTQMIEMLKSTEETGD